jgi:hypothetical protein
MKEQKILAVGCLLMLVCFCWPAAGGERQDSPAQAGMVADIAAEAGKQEFRQAVIGWRRYAVRAHFFMVLCSLLFSSCMRLIWHMGGWPALLLAAFLLSDTADERHLQAPAHYPRAGIQGRQNQHISQGATDKFGTGIQTSSWHWPHCRDG